MPENFGLRISALQSELASLKQQRKEEKKVAKVQCAWVSVKKRMPDQDALRVIAWTHGQAERCWYQNEKWYAYDGTFFLTEKDRINDVMYWMPRDWMTSREWPQYGPGIANRLRYYWRRMIWGAQDMAHDLRPKGWGSKAQLDKKVVFYKDSRGNLMTGLPEFMPAPQGFSKVVCNSALEAERYSNIQRQQERYQHGRVMEERAEIEGRAQEQIRSERRTLIANARNSLNRDFLIAANERFDKKHKPWEYERESYLHAEAHEQGH